MIAVAIGKEKSDSNGCSHHKNNFLVELKNECMKNGTILIFDEMITGFRWDIGGAQTYFNVIPDQRLSERLWRMDFH